MTNLRVPAGLPFLSGCTCFTTLNTSHVPQGPGTMLVFTFQTDSRKKKKKTKILERAYIRINKQEGMNVRLEKYEVRMKVRSNKDDVLSKGYPVSKMLIVLSTVFICQDSQRACIHFVCS